MKSLQIAGIIFATALVILGIVYLFVSNVSTVTAGVASVEAYMSTTTTATVSGTFDGSEVLQTGQGVFGGITITGANTGWLLILDATTTNALKRAPSMSTTSIVIADITADLVAGTYVFDAQFKNGLLVDKQAGISPTSTIMWKR